MAEKHEEPRIPAPAHGQQPHLGKEHVPSGMLHQQHDQPRDEGAEANAKRANEIATQSAPQIPPDQLATPPSSPPHAGGKQVEVLMGPYRGSDLIMPEAEAENAINDHWAIEPVVDARGRPRSASAADR